MNYKPTSLQQKWLDLQQIVFEQGSETKEKRAIMKYLREDLGFKDTRSSKISDRTPDGRHVRIYVWRDTPIGTIALTTGPNIVPEIHFMVHGNVAAEYINHQPTTKLLIPSAGQRPTLFAVPVPQRLIKAYHSQSMGDAAIKQRPSFPKQSRGEKKRKNPSKYASSKDSLLNKVQSSIRYRHVRKNPQYDNLNKFETFDVVSKAKFFLRQTYGNIGDYGSDYGFADLKTSLELSNYFDEPVLMNCIEAEIGQMQVSWGGKGLDKHRIFMMYTTNGDNLQIALGRPLETPDTYNIIFILDGAKVDLASGLEQVRKAWEMRDQLPNTEMVVEDTIPTLDTVDQEELDKAIEDDVVTEQYATDNPEQPISDPVDPIVNMAAEIEEEAKSEELEAAVVDVQEVSGFIDRKDLNIDMFKSKDILEIKYSGGAAYGQKTFIVSRITSPRGYYKKVNLKVYTDGKVKKGGVSFALVARKAQDEPIFVIGDMAIFNFSVKLLEDQKTGMVVAQAETKPEPIASQPLNISGTPVKVNQKVRAYSYAKQGLVLADLLSATKTDPALVVNTNSVNFLNNAVNMLFFQDDSGDLTLFSGEPIGIRNQVIGYKLEIPQSMSSDDFIQLLAFIRCLGFQIVNVDKTDGQINYSESKEYNVAKVINSLVNDPEGTRKSLSNFGLYFLPMENNYSRPVKISVDWSKAAEQYGSQMAQIADETVETTQDTPEPVETPSQAIEEPVRAKKQTTIIKMPAFSKSSKEYLIKFPFDKDYRIGGLSRMRKKISSYIHFVTDGRMKYLSSSAKELMTMYSPVADSLTLEETVDILAKIRCAGFETMPMNVALMIESARTQFVRVGVFDGRHFLAKLKLFPIEFVQYGYMIVNDREGISDVPPFSLQDIDLSKDIEIASNLTQRGEYALKVDWTAEAAKYGEEAVETAVESVAEEPVTEPEPVIEEIIEEPVIEEIIEEPVIEEPKAVLKVDERYYNSILSAKSLNYQQRLSLPAGSLVMLRKVANGRLFIRFTEVEITGDTTIASSSDDVVLFRYGYDMNDVYSLLRKLFPQYSLEWIQENAIGHDFDLGEYTTPVEEEAYSGRRRRRRRRSSASATGQVSDGVGIGSTLTVLNAGSFLQNIPDNVYLTRQSDVLAILPNGNYVKFNRGGILDKGKISEQVLIDFDGALIAGQAAQSDIEKVYTGSASPRVMMRKFR